MKRIVFVGILICLCSAAALRADSPCNLQTFTGTYALYEKGSSSILDPNSQPHPYHWAGAVAPFLALGEVTMGPNGIGEGFYWIRIGSFNSGPDPVPLELTITEINEDCTGKWQFVFDLLGTPYTIVERFVVSDNGREVHSIPTATGVPTMAWIGEAHRMSKPGELLGNCGSHTAKGKYLMAADNLVRLGPNPILSDAVLLLLDIANSGDVTGTLYEKLGPTGNIQLPVWGTLTVSEDCSFTSSLNAVVQGNPTTIPLRGVFFDEGKEFYGLNVNARTVGTQYSFGHGKRIGPE